MAKLLSDYFQQIAYKKLSAVETDHSLSNQHEFNGIANLRKILGTRKREIQVVQIYLNDHLEYPLLERSILTWYDAREGNPSRSSEYRLYYKSTRVTEMLQEGDLMIVAQRPNGQFINIFAGNNSSAENQLKLLFSISGITNKIETRTIEGAGDEEMSFIREFILEQLGIIEDVSKSTAINYLEEMLSRFPDELPSTKEFSAYARSTVRAGGMDDDAKIVAWWDRETRLFKLYEKHLFDRTRNGEQDDIDAFIALSLTLQNRRKSRAGLALENHMEQILIDNGVRYKRNAFTEGKSKPDFIFPDIESYRDRNFPSTSLHMLAVKTSCKDRWRQVLPEAARISHKHLLTLEPGISENQTNDMISHKLTLVLPESIHPSYTLQQQKYLLNVSQFLDIVK